MYLNLQKTKQTLLIFFLLIIFSFAMVGLAKDNSPSSKSVFVDSDQDGLSDQEEAIYKTDPHNPDTDGDGYSDGTEVKSGYDPLKPAPNDKLAPSDVSRKQSAQLNKIATDIKNDAKNDNSENSNKNLTKQLSAKLVAMISDNENNGSKTIKLDQINSLIDETISTASQTDPENLPKVDKDKIKIKKQKYSKLSKAQKKEQLKKDDEEYLSSVFYIVANNLPHSVANQKDIQNFSNEIVDKISVLATDPQNGMKYFDDLADRGQEILKQLNDVEVPKDMLDLHIRGLQLALYAISLKDNIKIDPNDPISSLISISGAQSLITLSSDFMTRVQNKMNNLNLTNLLSQPQQQKKPNKKNDK